jgi:hypothetical protein
LGTTSEAGDAEDDPSSILEEFANDPTQAELAGFINRLNVDEQVHLVALAWVGRGTFSTDEFDEAVQTARHATNGSGNIALSPRHAPACRLS